MRTHATTTADTRRDDSVTAPASIASPTRRHAREPRWHSSGTARRRLRSRRWLRFKSRTAISTPSVRRFVSRALPAP